MKNQAAYNMQEINTLYKMAHTNVHGLRNV